MGDVSVRSDGYSDKTPRRLNESLRICSSSSRRGTGAPPRWTRSSAATPVRPAEGELVLPRRRRASDDLIQEGLIGLYKAVRDFRPDKETSFRSFAELCVTRQIITAIKTATRFKHSPLNTYVSFSHTPAGQEPDGDCTLGDALPGPRVNDPAVLRDLDRGAPEPRRLPRHDASRRSSRTRCASTSRAGPTRTMAEELGCDTKTIDNALQRVKRKILNHQRERQVLA